MDDFDLEWVETEFGSYPVVVVSEEEWSELNHKMSNKKPCQSSSSSSSDQ